MRKAGLFIVHHEPGTAHRAGSELAESLRFSYYDSADPLLLFLYRAKSLKESESLRLSELLVLLGGQPLTAGELLDLYGGSLPDGQPLPDEKTIRADLKYLEEVGVVRREPGGRPYHYRLRDELTSSLTAEELLDLYDFIDIMANTQVPSVQGYMLRDSLKRLLPRLSAASGEAADTFLYKYHYYSRILDEAHLHELLRAIGQRRRVRFLYFSPKKGSSYASQNTNPLFERETSGTTATVLPLRVVYDHQYGRWYLLAHKPRFGVTKFRMEGVTQLEALPDGTVDEEEFARRLQALDECTARSWLVDTGRSVVVRARFYNPEGESAANFIKDRVLLQGQWGQIVEEDDQSFVYEIEVNGTTEIKPWLRSFGSSCEVLEPQRLRREMIEEWKEMQSYYEPF